VGLKDHTRPPIHEWIRIQHLADILDEFRPTQFYHPDDPRYKEYWGIIRKKLIEGIWFEQDGGVRYVPGKIGWYGVFCRFFEWEESTGNRIVGTPNVRDIEWHRAYHNLEAGRFSGFTNDNEFTSDWAYFDVIQGRSTMYSKNRLQYLYNDKGELKEFIHPRKALYGVHSEPKGNCLYFNQASNEIEVGSRGGGKSYWCAMAEVGYELVFRNRKYAVRQGNAKTLAEIEVTSAGGGKATELLQKTQDMLDALKDPAFPELGVYSYPGGKKIEPSPFYKKMEGRYTSNNKENRWINEYKTKVGNEWIVRGNGDYVINTNYSPNQREGAQKSAGGRRTRVIHEEIGLNELLLDAWGNNEGMVGEANFKYAPQKGIGTSGNIEVVGPMRTIYENPKEYKCLRFIYDENNPNIERGFFLNLEMVDPRFKDEDGNTDIKASKQFHKEEYEKLEASTTNPDVINNHRMNYPRVEEDMWVQAGINLFPVKQAEARKRELLEGELYKQLRTPIRLHWDSNNYDTFGVSYTVLTGTDVRPFDKFPYGGRKHLEGCFLMFIHPNDIKLNGKIPNDAVITTVDPYSADAWEDGGSLGSVYYYCNPKYTPYGLPGNKILACYNGKPIKGTDEFAKIVIMGHQFYGGCKRTLYYEDIIGGSKIREVAIKYNRSHFLAFTPQFSQGNSAFGKKARTTGYKIGSNKKSIWEDLGQLLENGEVQVEKNGEIIFKRVVEEIPDLYLLDQIIEAANYENLDAISSLQVLPIAIAENEIRNKSVDNTNKGFASMMRKLIKQNSSSR